MEGLRLFQWEDLDALICLLHACEPVDKNGFVPTAENMRHQLSVPGFEAEKFLYVLPNGEEIDAFGVAVPIPGPGGTTIQTHLTVHPDRRAGGMQDDLLRFLEARAAEWCAQNRQTATLHTGVQAHQTDYIDLCERNGFQATRWFLQLERDLEQPIPALPIPPGIAIRALRMPDDIQAFHFALTDAFLDHWNPINITLEQMTHLLSRPDYRADLTLLAFGVGDEPAGLCSTEIRTEYNQQHNTREGYIEELGVRRPFRRLGLGRALLTQGLILLRNEGMTTAVLDVDSESPTGATRLYEAVGFTERKRRVIFQKPVG